MIRLGTREVEAYALPEWEFDKILYIEKSGLQAQLAPYQIGQRYDMAIIYGNGYSPIACRDLLARSAVREITIFVLHDGDLDGYVIARTLGEATKRMPNHSVEVIDLGLTVPQAISEGLETETDVRKCALPSELVLDDDALRWFTGTPFSAPERQDPVQHHPLRAQRVLQPTASPSSSRPGLRTTVSCRSWCRRRRCSTRMWRKPATITSTP